MSAGGVVDARTEAVRAYMQQWLHQRTTGCHFVSRLAKDSAEFAACFKSSSTRYVAGVASEFVSAAAERERLAIIAFPDVVDEPELVDLLCELCRTGRWKAFEAAAASPGPGRFGLDLRWQLEGGLESNAMGFAPSTMCPVTRRAPLYALALWPRPHANGFRKKPFPVVGIGDTPPGIEDAALYKELQQKTQSGARQISSIDPLAPANPTVSFYLSAEALRQVLSATDEPKC